MDNWQQLRIDDNFSTLVNGTRCTVELLSILREENVISNEHLESLSNETRPNSARSAELYRWLKTRRNAYDVLKNALLATCQTGVFDILNMPSDQDEIYAKYEKLDYEDTTDNYGTSNTSIHQGTFGTRKVLVKVSANSNGTCLDKAKNEVNFLLKADWHENIVRCFVAKFITKGNCIHFAVALDYQCNLKKFSENTNVQSIARDLIPQIFTGVKFLHSQKIIHCNLKPESILVSRPSVSYTSAKIGEFELAQELSNENQIATMSNLVLQNFGDGSFYSPEVITFHYNNVEVTGNEKDDVNCSLTLQTDVFCLGVLLYFVLSGGKHPFGNKLEIMLNIFNNTSRINEGYLEPCSSDFRETLLNMLSANPSNRPDLSLLDFI